MANSYRRNKEIGLSDYRTLYHVSPSRNDASIEKEGVSPLFSKCAGNAIHIGMRSMLGWAILHIAKRHGVRVDQLSVWTVRVPRSRIHRRGRGWWYYLGDRPLKTTGVAWPAERLVSATFEQ